ncbi:MAG: hypothetical protein EA415_09230, partial [Sphaerobacteraceae bacterium]
MSLFNKFDAMSIDSMTSVALSRRQFVRRAAALGLATPAIAGLLA